MRSRLSRQAFAENYRNYVVNFHDNLIAGVEPWMFRADLCRGDGSELKARGKSPPKFHAAHSSSALTVNSFAPWKGAEHLLQLGGVTQFREMTFERKCPNGLKTRHCPNLDLFAEGETGIAAVESKCTEYLAAKSAEFSEQYEGLKGRKLPNSQENLIEPNWLEMLEVLRTEPRCYGYLDAAQLVKHYIGLRHTYGPRPITLLYIFWEPTNADEFRGFEVHHEELRNFTQRVSGGSVRVGAISYMELWKEWEQLTEPTWVKGHIASLRERYALNI